MSGNIFLWIAFISAVASTILYLNTIKNEKYIKIARKVFLISIFSVILSSILLLIYILQHRFEFNYIWSYSSRDLPTALLVTTFWAGQEGSLLLWTLFTALIGIFLLTYSKRKGIEIYAVSTYAFIMAIILFLITVKSPFQYIWEIYNEAPKGFIPRDGRGLNPLLQNFWMIIHPPVLFIGFASLAVPFVFAVVALWQKKYNEWISITLPWVLFGAISLGAGLIFGGYWAYGVLGWGGWWGWDPVENSSLIPWIVAIILIHTMIVQMQTCRFVRTNFILAILTYLLVIYSTFLTRSGILSNTSVHSFVEPGTLIYTLLILWLLLITIFGFGLVYFRRKELRSKVVPSSWFTRETLISFAAIVMGICATIILFGTSKPIFSNSAVEPSFYDKTTLPFAILMMLLLGISIKTKWNQEEKSRLFKQLLVPSILSILVSIVLFFFGLRDFFSALLVTTSLFALFVSIQRGYQIVKEQPQIIGGTLSHIGVAILFIGIIASGRYGQKQSVSLPINQPQVVFNDTLIYTGTRPTKDGKYICEVILNNNGKKVLEPVMFVSSYNNSVMRNPDYISFLTKDFYIEPVTIEEGKTSNRDTVIILSKGEPLIFDSMQIQFKQFDMTAKSREKMLNPSDAITIGAILEVKVGNEIQTVTPATTFKMQEQPKLATAYLEDKSIGFQLLSMNVASTKDEKSKIQVKIIYFDDGTLSSSQPVETLIAEVSVKPFMNLIWLSAFFIILGFVFAMIRRFKLAFF